jgi:hypothetical protein
LRGTLARCSPSATLTDVQQPNTDEKHAMTEEHPVSRIARLVYDRPDSVAALAAELCISPEKLAEWLAADLAADTRLLMMGFAAKKSAVLRQRAHQLLDTANAL